MRPLTLAISALALLFVLGCSPKAEEKPVPINPGAGDGAPAATAEPTEAAPVETAAVEPSGDAGMAIDIAKSDEAFKSALGTLAEAAEQDIAMAKDAQAAQAEAMEKLGGALSEEVAAREEQVAMMAKDVVESLKAKGYAVVANVVEINKTDVPAPAQDLVTKLMVGETSKVFEWNGGYGVIRKIAESDTQVKLGYIWATKEVATTPPAAAAGH